MYLIEMEEKTIFIKNVLPQQKGNGWWKQKVYEGVAGGGAEKKRGLKTVSRYWKFYPIESE